MQFLVNGYLFYNGLGWKGAWRTSRSNQSPMHCVVESNPVLGVGCFHRLGAACMALPTPIPGIASPNFLSLPVNKTLPPRNYAFLIPSLPLFVGSLKQNSDNNVLISVSGYQFTVSY